MRRDERSGALLALAGLIACLALLLTGCGGSTGPRSSLAAVEGLRVTLTATCLPTAPSCDVKQATRRRCAHTVAPPLTARRSCRRLGSNRRPSGVVVELPRVWDIASVQPLLTPTGALAFVDFSRATARSRDEPLRRTLLFHLRSRPVQDTVHRQSARCQPNWRNTGPIHPESGLSCSGLLEMPEASLSNNSRPH